VPESILLEPNATSQEVRNQPLIPQYELSRVQLRQGRHSFSQLVRLDFFGPAAEQLVEFIK
jgi:hypothetical protein